ncbi:hypothetical protein HK102_002856 [Quaeritorhiza haematococci]|nr:hypothetical protein HK102_002856 [Quaeritorhiza haematococci]
MPPQTHRIAVVGAGYVGATIAYTIVLRNLASEVLLIDINNDRCTGQVADISSATFTTDTPIRCGTFAEAGQCDIIVLAAGTPQTPNECRLKRVGCNIGIVKECVEKMKPIRGDAVMVVVANPVDVLTYFAMLFAGLPRNQVIGTGTSLDTSRLRVLLSQSLSIAKTSLHIYTLGEHGDTQFVAWSSAHVGNTPISEVPGFEKLDKSEVEEEVRRKGGQIIAMKGATSYGIGACASSIIESILFHRNRIEPVSHYIEDLGVCLSLPAVIGSKGVQQTLKPILSKEEEGKLWESAKALRGVINKYEGKV